VVCGNGRWCGIVEGIFLFQLVSGCFHQCAGNRLHIRDARRLINSSRWQLVSNQKTSGRVNFKQAHNILMLSSERLFSLIRSSKMAKKKKPEEQPMTQTKMVPYKMNAKYYLIVRITSTQPIPHDPSIHQAFRLNKRYSKDTNTLSYNSERDTKEKEDYMYHTCTTPLCYDAGWLFHMKAGMRKVMGNEMVVCGYKRDDWEEQTRKGLEEVDVPGRVRLVVEEDVHAQREICVAVQEMEQQYEEKDGRKVVRLKRRDRPHMWFGVASLNVKYEHEVNITIDELKKG
jgi:hypothetical protein